MNKIIESKSWDQLKKLSDYNSKENRAECSIVYEISDDYVIKVFNKERYKNDIQQGLPIAYDYEPLMELDSTGLIPKLYAWEFEDYVVMENIKGLTLYESIKIDPIKFRPNDWRYKKIIGEITSIIEAGWEPGDLKPFHIYFTEDSKLEFIDFTMYFKTKNAESSLELAMGNLNTYMDNYNL